MYRIIIIFLIISLILVSFTFAEGFKRFNNLSIYQHSRTQNYKVSLFTSITKDTWFVDNVLDRFYSNDGKTQGYYSITTAGKYITKNTSVKVQVEQGDNFETNYYLGMGFNF